MVMTEQYAGSVELARAIHREMSMKRGRHTTATLVAQTPRSALIQIREHSPAVGHFVLTTLTFGLYAPVWIIVRAIEKRHTYKIELIVGDDGKLYWSKIK